MQNQANATPSLESAIEIGFLAPGEAVFYQTPGGFIGLCYRGQDFGRVILRRALPIGNPFEYISVADHEQNEIAILRAVSELSGEQQRLILDELNRRYYCPIIHEVQSVKDKMGYVYMELLVGAGPGDRHEKSCAVKDVSRNIRMLGEDRLLIFDVDGNRYMVESLAGLDKKSLRRLEPYLF